MIKSDSFPAKKLVYNHSEQRQINELSLILSAGRLDDVKTRLRTAGMRTGFCNR